MRRPASECPGRRLALIRVRLYFACILQRNTTNPASDRPAATATARTYGRRQHRCSSKKVKAAIPSAVRAARATSSCCLRKACSKETRSLSPALRDTLLVRLSARRSGDALASLHVALLETALRPAAALSCHRRQRKLHRHENGKCSERVSGHAKLQFGTDRTK